MKEVATHITEDLSVRLGHLFIESRQSAQFDYFNFAKHHTARPYLVVDQFGRFRACRGSLATVRTLP